MIEDFMVAYYKDGSSVMRGDFITKYLNDADKGRPLLIQVHGAPNDLDKQAIKNAVDQKVGKVEYV